MFEISELTASLSRRVIATAETFEGAKEYVRSMGALVLEDDEEHDGCADAFLSDGRCVAIQPRGFRIDHDSKLEITEAAVFNLCQPVSAMLCAEIKRDDEWSPLA